jgi:SAM-dependent methyltransferase
MEIDYLQVEEQIRADYRRITTRYRQDDEIEVTTLNHQRLGRNLRQICRSFSQPITVLDVGCGTGRYFHCLENVARLVGMDVSEAMLAAARNPVRQERISATRIELIRENAYLASFSPGTFDFIYSLGMFGHGCPVTVPVCERFFEWLRPMGKVFFNVVDAAGLPVCHRVRRRLRAWCYPRLTARLQQVLDARERRSPFFSLARQDLHGIIKATRFSDFSIASHACTSPLWNGSHLECLAIKLPAEGEAPVSSGLPR